MNIANEHKRDELEAPPSKLKSLVREHFDFPVQNNKVLKTENTCEHVLKQVVVATILAELYTAIFYLGLFYYIYILL